MGKLAKFLDSVIGAFAPQWALNRTIARESRAELLNYAAQNRPRRVTYLRSGSADEDLLEALPDIRRNSRAMVRDDANAQALVSVLCDNVIGTGLVAQNNATARLTGMSDEQTAQWNRDVDDFWAHAAQEEMDATQHQTFSELQRLVFEAVIVDGENLSHRVRVPRNSQANRRTPMAIELIDVDRLESPVDREQQNEQIRAGIERGQFGQAVRYWILPKHPDDVRWENIGSNKPVPIQKWRGLRNVVHTFRRTRTGQTRGVPLIASTFGLVDSLNDYIESEAIAARAASKICMWIKSNASRSMPSIANAQNNASEPPSQRLVAGTVRYLGENEEIQAFDPQRPNSQFEAFIVRMLRSISSAMGMPYELVAKQFDRMNYSSSRVALQEARRGFEIWQAMMVHQFCRPWRAAKLKDAILEGVLSPPGRQALSNLDPYLEALWVPDAWGYVDPTKEIAASALAIREGLSTPQMEAARNGTDWETNMRATAKAWRIARTIEQEEGIPEGTLVPGMGQSAQLSFDFSNEPEEPIPDAIPEEASR